MKPNKPFTSISDKILFDKRVSLSALKVYLLICQHAYGKKVISFPSQDTLAFYCAFKRETVNRLIKELVKLGYIKSARVGNQLNNEYLIELFPESEVKSFIMPIKENCKQHVAEIRKQREESAKKSKSEKKSDVTSETSDVTPQSHRDVISETKVMCPHGHTNQYNKNQVQFEAIQILEDAVSASAETRLVNSSGSLEKTSEGIVPKDTNSKIDSVPSEAPVKDSVKNLNASSDFQQLFDKPAQHLSSVETKLSSAFAENASFENYLEKKKTMTDSDIMKHFPQYAEYVLDDLVKRG